jgi:hypothetical protein
MISFRRLTKFEARVSADIVLKIEARVRGAGKIESGSAGFSERYPSLRSIMMNYL